MQLEIWFAFLNCLVLNTSRTLKNLKIRLSDIIATKKFTSSSTDVKKNLNKNSKYNKM